MKLIVYLGMMDISCKNTVELNRYVNISKYYISDGSFGRMTGKYIERGGKIEETPRGGKL